MSPDRVTIVLDVSSPEIRDTVAEIGALDKALDVKAVGLPDCPDTVWVFPNEG